jgi:CheY-like chemotaxis protein
MSPVNVLLVEDNEGDILLTREALEDAKIHINLAVVNDGKEAIDFLNKEKKYAGALTPDLMLLDVNLPKKNGLEVLQYIKQSHHLKQIPVIMLTTSSSPRDIKECYSNYANCYITKPIDAGDFLAVVSSIQNFWISIVKLPSQKSQ